MKKNVVLVDFIPEDTFNFHQYLSRFTKLDFTTIGWKNSGLRTGIHDEIARYIGYFTHAFSTFLKRKDYDFIVAWQQFYGLLFAFYCQIFHVEKINYLIIMTFIYKKKAGWLGIVYEYLMKKIVSSIYIDRLVVFSNIEIDYYAKLFGVPKQKFCYIPLGIEERRPLKKVDKSLDLPDSPKFFLSVGRSNRDYKFLIDSLQNEKIGLVILCDYLKKDVDDKYIKVYTDKDGDDYLALLEECYGVILSLKDPYISSGQLVLLQAMQYGKPVIVTETETVIDYVEDGKTAFVISKTKGALLSAITRLLNDAELYYSMSTACRRRFDEMYSIEALAKQISELIKEGIQNENFNSK